ncbi:MAG: fenitrothion hydrolase [Thermoleophilaceae bacterium]
MEWLIAHGLVGRSDLPIPEWLFGWAAAIVLIVSFVALAVLWPDPKFEGDRGWRRLFALPQMPVDVVCGAIGVFLFGVTIWAGLTGEQTAAANWASTFVYVIFWLGFAAASVLFGDVFRAFNPWRAIARAVAGVAKLASGGNLPEPLPYPERLGRWPAAAGIFAFAFMELAATNGDMPQNIAIAALVYSAFTWIAMALYGIDRWTDRGEAFSVYYNLFSRISIWERRGRDIGVRRPLSGLAALNPVPGTVPLLAVMIGSVTFDGAAEGQPWTDIAPDLADFFGDLGFSPENSLMVTYGIGLVAAIGLVYGFYRLGIAGARSVGGGFTSRELADKFIHSLVPIAFVYAAAHYMTLLLFQGQAIWFLASDPLGEGDDFFGTADRAIDYSLIGANATWYWQVTFVILGHVGALMLAHDRALALYKDAKEAVRSQYWMLGIMVGFTTLALWLLSQANQ